MQLATSVYLDAVRFLASVLVFVYHFTSWKMFGFDFHVPNEVGHRAVLIFFVLSGYVIAYVTHEKERDPRTYMVSRFARLYSVCIPALILAVVLDSIGMQLNAALYDANAHEHSLIRVLASTLFLNQMWNFTITPLSNGAYWSVAYEFWYYMIFAALFFLRGNARWLTVAMLCALVGPRVLLLMPLWLLGVWIYRVQQVRSFNGRSWAICFPVALSAFLFLLFAHNPLDGLIAQIKALLPYGYLIVAGQPIYLGAALSFPADYLFGFVFALTILSSHAFFRRFVRRDGLVKAIRACASYTFSQYLFHVPLLTFYRALFDHDPTSAASVVLLGVSTIASVLVLGRYTEHRKGLVHAWIEQAIERVKHSFRTADGTFSWSFRSQ